MAIAFVQADNDSGEEGSGVTSLTITIAGTVVGNYLVVGGAVFDTDSNVPASWTVGDGGGNTYTQRIGQTHFGGGANNDGRGEIWTAEVVTGGTRNVVVTPGDTVNMTVSVLEYSGVDTADPIAGTAVAGAGTGTSAATSACTPDADGVVVGLCLHNNTGVTFAPAAGWTGSTERAEVDENNDQQAQNMADAPGSNGVAQTPTWTISSSSEYLCMAVPLKAAAAGGRTTKNTRAAPLGIKHGMGFRMGV